MRHLYNIHEIPKDGLEIKGTIAIDDFSKEYEDLCEGVSFIEPIFVQAFIKESPEGGYRVKGVFKFVCSLICIRCLDEFEIEIEKPFNVLVKRVVTEGKYEVELTREDLETYPLEGENIDIFVLIAGELYMSLPDYPLCDEDCKGLCQFCGINLNYSTCECLTGQKKDQKGLANPA